MRKNGQFSYFKDFDFIVKNIKKIPRLIIIDYELPVLNVPKYLFVTSRISACFFPFSQIICRKIQSTNFIVVYKSNPTFNLHLKMIIALAFVPEVFC